MDTFQPREKFRHESYSSAYHATGGALGLFVSASDYAPQISVRAVFNEGMAGIRLTAAQARALAAELIAAADSLALPVPEVTELECAA